MCRARIDHTEWEDVDEEESEEGEVSEEGEKSEEGGKSEEGEQSEEVEWPALPSNKTARPSSPIVNTAWPKSGRAAIIGG